MKLTAESFIANSMAAFAPKLLENFLSMNAGAAAFLLGIILYYR